MPIARNVNVQVQVGLPWFHGSRGEDGHLLQGTNRPEAGQHDDTRVPCSLPKRQLAASFGCKTRPSYYDIRNAVLTGAPEDLWPKMDGTPTRSKRTKEMEALIIRTRFETDLNMDEIAETLTQQGFPVSARVVGRVLADDGLSQKNAWHRAPSLPGSWPTRRSKSLMGPTSRGPAASPGMTSSTTSRLYSNAAARPRVQGAFSSSPPFDHGALRTSPRL